MASTVKTDFIVTGVDNYVNSVERAGRSLDSLSNVSAKSALADNFKQITNDIRTSLTNAEKSITSLKTTTETVTVKPTISRYWQNEEAEVKKSVAEIRRATGSVSFPSPGNPGQASLDRIAGISGNKRSSALIDTEKLYGASRFNDAAAFTKIGNEAEKAAAKVAGLRRGTTEFQRTFLELTDDFAPRGTNRPFNAVGRELFGRFNSRAGSDETANGAARLAALTRVKEAGIAVAAAEKAATAASAAADLGSAAAKSTATAASVSLTAAKSAETAATKALTAAELESTATFAGIGLTGAAAFGVLAVAGAVIVKVTSDIRKEAERRLKLENDISGAINRQILGAKELAQTFAESRKNAENSRIFEAGISTDSLEQLKRRRANIEVLEGSNSLSGDGKATQTPASVIRQKQIQELDRLISGFSLKSTKLADEAFSKNAENFRTSQEQAAKYEGDRAEKAKIALEKRTADLKKANELIAEIGKSGSSAFIELNSQLNKDNPFVSAFTEAERASKSLYENVKNLTPELQKQAFAMQSVIDANKLFSTRLDNDFAARDLRNKAQDLRDFKPKAIEDTGKFFSDFIAEGLKQISNANGGSFVSFNRLANGGFSQSDARNSLLNVYDKLGSGGTFRRTRSFADLTDKEKFDFANKDNIGFQNRFSASLDLAQNRRALNPEQQAQIDRKIVSLASGVDLSKLTDSQRDRVATAAENLAKARENAENTANDFRKDSTGYLKNINEYIETLKQKAEKGGTESLEFIIKDETAAGVEAKKRAKTASPKDAENYYGGKNTGTYYGDYQKQF